MLFAEDKGARKEAQVKYKMKLLGLPRKAWACLLSGIIFVLTGLSQFLTYNDLGPKSKLNYQAHLTLFHDLRVYGVLFMVTGIVAILAPLWKRYSVGFFALMLMSTWWSMLFLVSFSLNGYSRSLIGTMTWLLVSGFLYIISSWIEYPDPLLAEESYIEKERNSHEK